MTKELLKFILLANGIVMPVVQHVFIRNIFHYLVVLSFAFMLHINKLQTKQGCSPKLWLFQICSLF